MWLKNRRLRTRKKNLKIEPDQKLDDINYCYRNINWGEVTASEKQVFEEVVSGYQSNIILHAKLSAMYDAYMFFMITTCITLLIMMLFGCTYKLMIYIMLGTMLCLIGLASFATLGAKIMFEEQYKKITEVVKAYNRKHPRE